MRSPQCCCGAGRVGMSGTVSSGARVTRGCISALHGAVDENRGVHLAQIENHVSVLLKMTAEITEDQALAIIEAATLLSGEGRPAHGVR